MMLLCSFRLKSRGAFAGLLQAGDAGITLKSGLATRVKRQELLSQSAANPTQLNCKSACQERDAAAGQSLYVQHFKTTKAHPVLGLASPGNLGCFGLSSSSGVPALLATTHYAENAFLGSQCLSP